MAEPVRAAVKQVDSSTWLIGKSLLLRCSSLHSAGVATWKDNDNSYYSLTDISAPPPAASALPQNSHVVKIHDAGDCSAVFSIGYNAFCKVRLFIHGATPEAVTLKFLHDQKPKLNFEIPEILHYIEDDDRFYLFLTRVPGQTLMKACPSLDDHWRQYYVHAVVQIIKDLAGLKGDKFGGVDGGNIPEWYLTRERGSKDISSASLQGSCQKMGMDCSDIVFYHADLGPGNIIVDTSSGSIGIIDWEIAGFFPRGWIRTKFRLSSGLDFEQDCTDNPHWWRQQVGQVLGSNGFKDYTDAWLKYLRQIDNKTP